MGSFFRKQLLLPYLGSILKENQVTDGTGMQNLYFFVDDSGVLHKNEPSGVFVYGGYVFSEREMLERKKREYKGLAKRICKELNIAEAKACHIKPKHKRALMNVMKGTHSFSCVVDIERLYDFILSDKRSIHRYKDYALKLIIKRKLQEKIVLGLVDPNLPLTVHLMIDEQATASNGYYDLKDSIYQELVNGVVVGDFSRRFEPILFGGLTLHVEYCSSHSNYLVQASDILANRVWVGTARQKFKLLQIDKHQRLHLP